MNTKKLCLAAAGIGLTVTLVIILTGCAALETKAVAVASGIDAMKVETTGSVSSGTVLPNIIVGGAVNSVCTAPAMDSGKTAQPTYSKSRRNSFFGSLFGIDNATETIAYTGVPGETADETAKRCQALAGLSTVSSTTNTSTLQSAAAATATVNSADTAKTE